MCITQLVRKFSLVSVLKREFQNGTNGSYSIFFCKDVGLISVSGQLGNCPPTPPLTQQQSTDNKLGLMLG